MRPIDADAVLDRYYSEYERQDICDGAEDREWLMKCLNEAPTLTPPNEWVNVDEKLPEPGERVLATDCGFVGEFYINERGQWQRYNVNCHALLMALDILYWMPLPKSPKEDE